MNPQIIQHQPPSSRMRPLLGTAAAQNTSVTHPSFPATDELIIRMCIPRFVFCCCFVIALQFFICGNFLPFSPSCHTASLSRSLSSCVLLVLSCCLIFFAIPFPIRFIFSPSCPCSVPPHPVPHCDARRFAAWTFRIGFRRPKQWRASHLCLSAQHSDLNFIQFVFTIYYSRVY